MKRAERFELITTPDSDRAVADIIEIRTETKRKRGGRGKVSKSEAIREAVIYYRNALVNDINPDDLD